MIRYEHRDTPDDIRLREVMRSVAGTEAGKTFFNWLFTSELGLFSEVQSDEDQVLHNLGVRLLEKMGAYHEYHAEDITSFLTSLHPYTQTEETDE